MLPSVTPGPRRTTQRKLDTFCMFCCTLLPPLSILIFLKKTLFKTFYEQIDNHRLEDADPWLGIYLQWTWIAANNWGSCHNGARGLGCGPQVRSAVSTPAQNNESRLLKLDKIIHRNRAERFLKMTTDNQFPWQSTSGFTTNLLFCRFWKSYI